MADQIALFTEPAPAPVADPPLTDLLHDLEQRRQLPVWAEMLGETWFARAWAASDAWHAHAKITVWAFGPRNWEGVAWHGEGGYACFDNPVEDATGKPLPASPVPCARCAAGIRAAIGRVTLAMLREGLARQRGAR